MCHKSDHYFLDSEALELTMYQSTVKHRNVFFLNGLKLHIRHNSNMYAEHISLILTFQKYIVGGQEV